MVGKADIARAEDVATLGEQCPSFIFLFESWNLVTCIDMGADEVSVSSVDGRPESAVRHAGTADSMHGAEKELLIDDRSRPSLLPLGVDEACYRSCVQILKRQSAWRTVEMPVHHKTRVMVAQFIPLKSQREIQFVIAWT